MARRRKTRIRRSRIKVVYDVLVAMEEHPLPTRIMYAANMSWNPMHKVFKELIAQGLVLKEKSVSSDKRRNFIYHLTQAGRDMIQQLKKNIQWETLQAWYENGY